MAVARPFMNDKSAFQAHNEKFWLAEISSSHQSYATICDIWIDRFSQGISFSKKLVSIFEVFRVYAWLQLFDRRLSANTKYI